MSLTTRSELQQTALSTSTNSLVPKHEQRAASLALEERGHFVCEACGHVQASRKAFEPPTYREAEGQRKREEEEKNRSSFRRKEAKMQDLISKHLPFTDLRTLS